MLFRLTCLAALLASCRGEVLDSLLEPFHGQEVLHTQAPSHKVAIIGAGAAGSSAAYHIRRYVAEAGIPLNITIFERNTYIGGRSTTVYAYNDSSSTALELGASIFVDVNYVLSNATFDFGLDTIPAGSAKTLDALSKSLDRPAFGIWNGESFVFTQASSTSWWWDVAKLLYRYGLSPVRAQNLMKKTVGTFLSMYNAPVFPFKSLSETVYSLGLTSVTTNTGEQLLRANKISDKFAQELVQAATRVNYAQNLPLIHGLETVVCLATDGAKSIAGGNWQIFASMCRHATSDVRLNTSVHAIERSKTGGYELQHKTTNADGVVSSSAEHFDQVVLAAPYQFSAINLPKTKSIRIPDEIPYVTLHVTLFTSPHLLSPAAFNLPAGSPVPRVVLTTLQPDERPGTDPHYPARAGFFSISTLQTVRNPRLPREEYAYKIFSAGRVDETFLAKILGLDGLDGDGGDDVTWVYRKVWKSYPYEYPRVTFEELLLDGDDEGGARDGGLWYTAGMESFISTMETNALMGKNIARLIVDRWIQ